MIRAENICAGNNDMEILRNLSLTVNNGDIVGVIGPSGSGKSYMLRCLVTLNKISSGKIFLDDTEITASDANVIEARKKIGMVFQNYNLFKHLCVVENVMSGLVDLQKMPKKEAYSKAMEILQMVGLADKAFNYPATLSGGQQQRAAIARTIAMEPDIILFDEPTSSLDPLMRGEVEAVIRLLAAQGHTMVIVTHEMELVKSVCKRVVFINDGKVFEEGTPEKIFDNPDNAVTKRFVKALRVLEFDVESKSFDFIGIETTLADFAYRNGISSVITNKVRSVLEELFEMVIIQPSEQNKMHILFEYNTKDKCIDGNVKFSGPPVDEDDPMYFISWPIIKMRTDELKVENIDEYGYTNNVTIKIK
ncbi:MAG: amino acid ABC transporter ATP-binding protein [Clostridiales bacterium]|nr:amino acid ABC transporter ATP-binding protein [Candidatus Equinaster intestinalis]